jgi:hypothetical protein
VIVRVVALLLLVALGGWLWMRRSRSMSSEPDTATTAANDAAAPAKPRGPRHEVEAARYWSDGEIRLAVEQFLFKLEQASAGHPLARQLGQQAGRTIAEVLRVLRDPELQMRLQRRRQGQTPWMRACLLLDQAPAAAHAEFVRRQLDDADEEVRLRGWLQLARIGADVVVSDLERGVAESASVREWVSRGLREALAAGRVGAEARRRLFVALVSRADGSEFDVLRALALLDEERAASEFAARGWAVG